MALDLQTQPTELIPLVLTQDNVVVVGRTRVTLDTVVDAFVSGSTPEEIVYQYSSLALADVYAVVGYYLNHKEEVEEYLERRRADAIEVRLHNESLFSGDGIRERLLAREK